MRLSIIIPAFNEAVTIEATLSRLSHASCQVIVVDGGSVDDTVSIAQRHTPHVLKSPKGRGAQQDMGARMATDDVFLFVHADTILPSHSILLWKKQWPNPR